MPRPKPTPRPTARFSLALIELAAEVEEVVVVVVRVGRVDPCTATVGKFPVTANISEFKREVEALDDRDEEVSLVMVESS